MERNIKDHINKSLEEHIKRFKEEIGKWMNEARYGERVEPSSVLFPKKVKMLGKRRGGTTSD